MGLWDGIEDTELYERGKYLPPGFHGVVHIKRTIAKESKRSGTGFLVEMLVVEVKSSGDPEYHTDKAPVPVRVGEKRTWWQSMTDKEIAFRAVSEWAGAVGGYDPGNKKEIEEHVMPDLKKTMAHATDNPADNDFVDMPVGLTTRHIITKKNKQDFTVHDWWPYFEADEEPQDVDEMAGK